MQEVAPLCEAGNVQTALATAGDEAVKAAMDEMGRCSEEILRAHSLNNWMDVTQIVNRGGD